MATYGSVVVLFRSIPGAAPAVLVTEGSDPEAIAQSQPVKARGTAATMIKAPLGSSQEMTSPKTAVS